MTKNSAANDPSPAPREGGPSRRAEPATITIASSGTSATMETAWTMTQSMSRAAKRRPRSALRGRPAGPAPHPCGGPPSGPCRPSCAIGAPSRSSTVCDGPCTPSGPDATLLDRPSPTRPGGNGSPGRPERCPAGPGARRKGRPRSGRPGPPPPDRTAPPPVLPGRSGPGRRGLRVRARCGACTRRFRSIRYHRGLAGREEAGSGHASMRHTRGHSGARYPQHTSRRTPSALQPPTVARTGASKPRRRKTPETGCGESATAHPSGTDDDQESPMTPSSPLTVLLAGDNAVMRAGLAAHLRRASGSTVLESRTGAEAVKTAGEELPDAVLLDVHIPAAGADPVRE